MKTFTYFQCEPGLYSIACWSAGRISCGRRKVYAKDLAANLAMLTRLGYKDMSKQRFNAFLDAYFPL